MTDGVKITLLDDKELDLVLNTEAMAELCDEFGDLEKIGDKLNNASYSEKIRLVPRLISILATQGEAIKGERYEHFPRLHPASDIAEGYSGNDRRISSRYRNRHEYQIHDGG